MDPMHCIVLDLLARFCVADYSYARLRGEKATARGGELAYSCIEQFQQWNGVSIYSQIAGRGLPVYLLHSLGGTARHWQFTMPALAAANCRVTAIDLPGHGRSGLSEGSLTPRRMGADLARSLSSPAVLVGNSLGGWVALQAYLHRPDRVLGICLVASAGLAGMPVRPPKLRLAPGASNLLEMLLASVFHHPERIDPLVQQSVLGGIAAPALLRLAPEGTLSPADLRRVRCPVLILWGENDQILPVHWAESFARHLGAYKKTILPDCGHLPQIECAERFNRELIAFTGVFQSATLNPASQ
ncbi:alpha/beta fold hydrolase [Gloeobacter kilaueensis]|nr:alpha/beta fold hydrolase [Gloeobacter kilaueensis]